MFYNTTRKIKKKKIWKGGAKRVPLRLFCGGTLLVYPCPLSSGVLQYSGTLFFYQYFITRFPF